MIFENESAIDRNLLKLVKLIKKHSNENPVIRLLPEKNSWVVTVPEKWISSGINITWNHINKKPFRVWWEVWTTDSSKESNITQRDVILDMEMSNTKSVIDALLMLRYSHLGIPKEVISFLLAKMKTASLEVALKSIGKETDILLTIEQIEILGITEQKGRIIGKKFGI